jgi:glucans biosynthesis protein C
MYKAPYQRRHDLDWLRVGAFTLLILFHTGMFFGSWSWHVKNPETSPYFDYVMIFLHQWRIPLLFFISGAAVWFAMEKYRTRRFAWERVKRLLLPLIFGMILLVPPQVYYERLTQGREFASYLEFYGTVAQLEPYPEGNLSWHHLWYLPYVLAYSLLLLPILAFLKSPRGRRLLSRLDVAFQHGGTLFVLLLPNLFSDLMLRPFWPGNYNNLLGDWAQFTAMLLVFFWGFLLASSSSVWPTLERNRFRLLSLAALTTFVRYLVWYGDFGFPAAGLEHLLGSLHGGSCILTILAFGSRHLRFTCGFLKYANQAVYPFYILHQTITVAAGFHMMSWNLSIPAKFALLVLITFGGCWFLYEFPIRRLTPLRPLFGLGPQSRRAAQPAPHRHPSGCQTEAASYEAVDTNR